MERPMDGGADGWAGRLDVRRRGGSDEEERLIDEGEQQDRRGWQCALRAFGYQAEERRDSGGSTGKRSDARTTFEAATGSGDG